MAPMKDRRRAGFLFSIGRRMSVSVASALKKKLPLLQTTTTAKEERSVGKEKAPGMVRRLIKILSQMHDGGEDEEEEEEEREIVIGYPTDAVSTRYIVWDGDLNEAMVSEPSSLTLSQHLEIAMEP